MPAFPVTPEQFDRYQRRARARVFWGHRVSGIVQSLERKGVRRQQAKSIVGKAMREFSAQMTLSGLGYVAAAALTGLVALVLHAPHVLRGEPVGAIDWAHPGYLATPVALLGAVFALIAGSRLLRALFRWV